MAATCISACKVNLGLTRTGTHWGNIGAILRLDGENGKEHVNYEDGLYGGSL